MWKSHSNMRASLEPLAEWRRAGTGDAGPAGLEQLGWAGRPEFAFVEGQFRDANGSVGPGNFGQIVAPASAITAASLGEGFRRPTRATSRFFSATTPASNCRTNWALPSSWPGMTWLRIMGQRAAMASWTVAPPALVDDQMVGEHQARHLIGPAENARRGRRIFPCARASFSFNSASRPTVMVRWTRGISSRRSMALPDFFLPVLMM